MSWVIWTCQTLWIWSEIKSLAFWRNQFKVTSSKITWALLGYVWDFRFVSSQILFVFVFLPVEILFNFKTGKSFAWKVNPDTKPGFFLTPAAEKTKTQGQNSSKKLNLWEDVPSHLQNSRKKLKLMKFFPYLEKYRQNWVFFLSFS